MEHFSVYPKIEKFSRTIVFFSNLNNKFRVFLKVCSLIISLSNKIYKLTETLIRNLLVKNIENSWKECQLFFCTKFSQSRKNRFEGFLIRGTIHNGMHSRCVIKSHFKRYLCSFREKFLTTKFKGGVVNQM